MNNENREQQMMAAAEAYAEMEDHFGEDMLVSLRSYVDTYSTTAAGRKYFYGEY